MYKYLTDFQTRQILYAQIWTNLVHSNCPYIHLNHDNDDVNDTPFTYGLSVQIAECQTLPVSGKRHRQQSGNHLHHQNCNLEGPGFDTALDEIFGEAHGTPMQFTVVSLGTKVA